MDPVSALGVVGTAISLFDLTKTLVKDAYKIMDKGEVGGLVVHEKVAQDLAGYTRQFEEWSPDKMDEELSEDEIALRSLSLKCSETARELLALLEPLKPKAENGQPGKMESIAIAGKAMMRKSEIEELAKRIEKYRDQMHFRAQAVLNQQNRESIQEGFSAQQENHSDLVQRIEQQKRDLEQQNEALQFQLSHLADLMHSAPGPSAGVASGKGLHEVLPAHREALLRHLHFRYMNDRSEDIKPSHRETFEWIFKDPSLQDQQPAWSDFPAWLRTGTGSYWIQGKPGAGKSTLTKFIDQHATTRECLVEWAGDSPLVSASFFFWYAGNDLQKSQEGMLRNLLYQLVRDHPDLIPHMMAEPSVEIPKLSVPQVSEPSLLELKGWFSGIAKASGLGKIPHRFCLLVDGLDEYVGNEWDLANFFQIITQTSDRIKLIVASRPHTPFVSAFASGPGLKVQDMTRSDIRRFATNKLSECADEMDAAQLIDRITIQSEGVFLWVALVTGNLVTRFHEGATMTEVQNELATIPSEIGDLYQRILDCIPKAYQSEAARMIQMIMLTYGHDGSLDDGEAKFNDRGAFDYCFGSVMWSALEFGSSALTMPNSQISPSELLKKDKGFTSRMRSRCFGLLEPNLLQEPFQGRLGTVSFVHRTCFEFFSDATRWKALSRMRDDPSFKVDTSLFLGTLGLLKLGADLPTFGEHMGSHSLRAATVAEISSHPIPKGHLDELEKSFHQRITAEGHVSRTESGNCSPIEYLIPWWDYDPNAEHGSMSASFYRTPLRGHRLDSFMRCGHRSHQYKDLEEIKRMPTGKRRQHLRMDSLDVSAREYLFNPDTDNRSCNFLYIAYLNGLHTYTTETLAQMKRQTRIATATRLMLFYMQLTENGTQIAAPLEDENERDYLDQLLDQGADPNYSIHSQVPLWAVLLVLFYQAIDRKTSNEIDTVGKGRNMLRANVLHFILLRFLDYGADVSQPFYHGGREYASGPEYLEFQGPPFPHTERAGAYTTHPIVLESIDPSVDAWKDLKQKFEKRMEQVPVREDSKSVAQMPPARTAAPSQTSSTQKGLLKHGKKGVRAGFKALLGSSR